MGLTQGNQMTFKKMSEQITNRFHVLSKFIPNSFHFHTSKAEISIDVDEERFFTAFRQNLVLKISVKCIDNNNEF